MDIVRLMLSSSPWSHWSSRNGSRNRRTIPPYPAQLPREPLCQSPEITELVTTTHCPRTGKPTAEPPEQLTCPQEAHRTKVTEKCQNNWEIIFKKTLLTHPRSIQALDNERILFQLPPQYLRLHLTFSPG